MNRVLILAGKCPSTSNFSRGWHHAFRDSGYECVICQESEPNFFSLFDKSIPDLVWAHSKNLTRGFTRAAIDSKAQLILFLSNYDDAEKTEKEYVELLVKSGLKVAFNTSHPEFVKANTEKWGVECLSCLTAADTSEYYPVPFDKSFISDISLVGTHDTKKEKFVNDILMPMTENNKWRTKIFGYGYWPMANYLGHLTPEEYRKVVSATAYNMVVGHPTNPTENMFRILSCGEVPFIYGSSKMLNFLDGSICQFNSLQEICFTIGCKTYPICTSNELHNLVEQCHSYKCRLEQVLEYLS